MEDDERFAIESDLLLEALYRMYGYDFRDYAEASIRRRLSAWLAGSGFSSLSEAQGKLLRDRSLFDQFVRGITVNVSEMFRDPLFFKALREQVVPHLKTYSFVKIWHAGCSTGEEVYSMAILLQEEGLAGRYRIYATDINENVLGKAREGIYPLQEMRRFTENYQKSGGRRDFADYYTARYDHAMLMPALKKDIVFAAHNLAVDADFGEMNMVFCRNVLIYFKASLKERVLSLFDRALLPGGFLCLGTKETLENRDIFADYHEIGRGTRIYAKCYKS
ncbi:protein glutamate methyltransferase CheR [Geotalea daltonii FRC-32]|uniref:Protein glutamate methyltransferase CheR n=1 Tax=Geotalea daltonii (strain DSM 22248 / JCM 15807 / FRC-32) TaxID=316067 RepID=B9M7B4_GEODF|nr:protein-glutamate O-methyltransferase CheR [Geotalea daltonii]ACM20202.1 protein glutamate methyltransferase CheR [Geotalea daltonii FRC-32]